MTVKQIERVLISLPASERLRLAHLLLSSLIKSEASGVSQSAAHEFEYEVVNAEWLTLSEPSLEFWNNEEDAYYDNL